MKNDLSRKDYLGYLTEYNKDIISIINNSFSGEDQVRFLDYRKKWDMAENCDTNFNFPINLDFELIDACNLSCPHCVRKSKGVRVTDGSIRLGMNLFQRAIDEGKKYGLASISIGNSGEGLLEKDVVKMVEYARQNGVLDVWLSTNGLLLTPEISRGLIQAGLTRISISVDAITEKTYKMVRGGDLKELIRNIEYFLSERERQKLEVPILRVTCIRLNANQDEVLPFVDYWDGKADSIGIQEYIDFDLEKKLISEEVEPIICPSPWRNLMIGTNGEVTPCCTFFGKKLVLGNLNGSTLKEIWDSEKVKLLRQNIAMHNYPKPCIDCLGVSKK